jgi:hypothetical protein
MNLFETAIITVLLLLQLFTNRSYTFLQPLLGLQAVQESLRRTSILAEILS